MDFIEAEAIHKTFMEKATPRKVKFNPLSLLNFEILTVAIIVLLLTSINLESILKGLSSSFGQSTKAVIANNKEWKSTGSHKTNYYGIGIYFPQPSYSLKTFVEIPFDVYQKYKVGDVIDIHYLEMFSNYPSLDEVPDDKIIFYCFVVGLLVVALYFTLKLRKQRFFLVQGTAVVGVVMNFEKLNTKGSGLYLLKTVYQYGMVKIEKTFVATNEESGNVIVLINPKNPKRSMLLNSGFFWQMTE